MAPRGTLHSTRLTSALTDSLSTIHEESTSPEKTPDALMSYYESLLQGMSTMDDDRAVHQVLIMFYFRKKKQRKPSIV